jgi:hypothetical protein
MKKKVNLKIRSIVLFCYFFIANATIYSQSNLGFADVYGLLAVNNYNLNASFTDHAVKLNWELVLTGNELAYAVERSINGIGYRTIVNGMIMSSGTTISATDWDNRLPTGTPWVYYRLVITDKNGHIKRSGAIKVKTQNADNEQATVFPNPAKNETTLLIPQSLTHKLIYVTLTNSSAKLVRKFVIENASEMETINISGIKAGAYYWRINTDNKKQAVSNGKLEIQ